MGNDRPFTGEYREVQVLKYTPESSFEVHLTDGFRILHIKYLTTKREVVDLLKKFRTANS
jgi:hypothetical protein